MRLLLVLLLPLSSFCQTLQDSVVILTGSGSYIRYINTYQTATYTNGDSISFRSTSAKKRGLVSPLALPISTATQTALDAKQATLVSATNIKTVNGNNLLGSGDISISSAVAWGNVTGTLSDQTDLNTALGLKAPLASPTFTGTVSGITATMVGLGNVDNTSNATERAATATLTNKTISGASNTLSNIAQSSITNYAGYTIKVQALTSSPADAATIYFGMLPKAPTTTANISKVYIRQSGTITGAELYCYSGTAGTNESWSIYVRVNNTTDYLIATVAAATSERVFSNTGLSISVSAGDYIEIKSVNPTWATNPLTTIFGGYIRIN